MNRRTLIATALTVVTVAAPASALAKPIGNEPPPKTPPIPTTPQLPEQPGKFPPILLVDPPLPVSPASPASPSEPAAPVTPVTPVEQPATPVADAPVNPNPGPTAVPAPDRTAPVLSKLRIKGRVASFSLSEASTITVRVERTGSAKGSAASTRTVKGKQGAGTVTIARQKAGSYRLRLTPRDAAGNAGRTVTARFAVR